MRQRTSTEWAILFNQGSRPTCATLTQGSRIEDFVWLDTRDMWIHMDRSAYFFLGVDVSFGLSGNFKTATHLQDD